MNINELLTLIQNNKIINNIESPYWIYDISIKISQENSVVYKKLYISLFSRNLNLKDGIFKLTFNINGIDLDVTSFKKLDYYRFQCVIDLSLEQEKVNLYLQSYTDEQGIETYFNKELYIQGVVYNGDKAKLEVYKDILGKQNYILAPDYNNVLWFCGCGRINSIKIETCSCGITLEAHKEICQINLEEFMLKKLKENFNIDIYEDVNFKLKNYVHKMSAKYKISIEKILSLFDIKELRNGQQLLLKEKAKEYVQTQEIQFDYHKTFNENIDQYVKKGVQGLITKELIIQYLELNELKLEFNRNQELYLSNEMKQKQKKLMITGILIAIVVILLIMLIIFVPKETKEDSNNKQTSNVNSSTTDGSEDDKKDEFETSIIKGINIIDTTKNRSSNYENTYSTKFVETVNYFEDDSKSEFVDRFCEKYDLNNVSDILDFYRLSHKFTGLTKKINPQSIQTYNGKDFIALNEDHFIVKETEKISVNQEKTYFYIGDKDGKCIYDNYDANTYILKTLDDGQILDEEIYVDGKLNCRAEYSYRGDELSLVIVYDSEDKVIQKKYGKDGKIVEVELFEDDDIYGTYTHEYEGEQLVSRVYKNIDGDFTTTIGYQQGLFYSWYKEYPKAHDERVFYYDENGICVGYETERYTAEGYEGEYRGRLIYDTENGIIVNAIFEKVSDEYVLRELYLGDMCEGLVFADSNDYFSEMNSSNIDSIYEYLIAKLMYLNDAYSSGLSDFSGNDQYILQDSDSKYITESDLKGMSEFDLLLARNEIYARHGRKFVDERIKEHFESCDWYYGYIDPDDFKESVFNKYEKNNIDTIVEYEKKKGYR